MIDNPMNAMLRRAARRRTTRTAPAVELVIGDVSAVAATLTPTQLQQFRDALLDAIDTTTTNPMGATR